ncbi:MAG: glycyl-radical enzyme activating protein [Candidatus Bipolaricaulota bacterium]|nr:MAG: glycyl-radical enzyme activating protein [Candidatus Bipolaricaulota bacterium]
MVPLEGPLSGSPEGLIFDIQAHSVHDGPGCRTTVFLSGCPLRCSWCANPEGLLPHPRLMVRASRCRADAYPCADACPHGAVRVDPAAPLPPSFERALCATCVEHGCVSACAHGALEISGRWISLDELMKVLDRDRDYWGPQGGITFSGGEPLSQPEFLLVALDACHRSYIHTVIETSAYADRDLLQEVALRVDWLFVDLKHMDPTTHRRGTGVSNERILANLEEIARSRIEAHVVVRVPVVPGFNDSAENLGAAARFLADLRLRYVNLLPFHRMAASKYAQLGQEYAHEDAPPPTGDEMEHHRRLFVDAGLECYVGAETPF